jgi:hypothetical protein
MAQLLKLASRGGGRLASCWFLLLWFGFENEEAK